MEYEPNLGRRQIVDDDLNKLMIEHPLGIQSGSGLSKREVASGITLIIGAVLFVFAAVLTFSKPRQYVVARKATAFTSVILVGASLLLIYVNP